jgi:lipopolysaccharide biosynthesis glycosyltransferase
MEKVNIVFSSDKDYSQHISVALCSLLENTNETSRLSIFVIDGGIEDNIKELLVKLAERYHSSLSFLSINKDIFNGANFKGHITEAAYYRIMIPGIFKKTVKKAIYLDCDILVRDNIINLWNIDIGGAIIGAIKLNEYNGYDKINLPQGASYFNSGVMIIDLDKWRRNKITEKSIQYIQDHPDRLIAHDQSVLNYLLHDKWYQIHYKWNLRTQIYSLNYRTAGFNDENIFKNVKENPSIVHFTTASKPWHYVNNHPLKEEYFSYLSKSEYPYTKYPERENLFSVDLILFGTGEKSNRVTNYLSIFNLEVAFYLDNNHKNEFFGKKVERPEYIRQYNREFIIIIASQHKEDITDQLIGLGLIEGIQFIKDVEYLSHAILEKNNK